MKYLRPGPAVGERSNPQGPGSWDPGYIGMYQIRMWHLTVLVKSRKAQVEAMHRTQQNVFGRDYKGKATVDSNTNKVGRATTSSGRGRAML